MLDNSVLVNVDPAVFGLLEFVSLIVGLTSLALAAIAIWLTLHFKKDTDRINDETIKTLITVKSESRIITEVIMAELKAYGSSARGLISQNIATETQATVSPETEGFIMSNNSTKKSGSQEKP